MPELSGETDTQPATMRGTSVDTPSQSKKAALTSELAQLLAQASADPSLIENADAPLARALLEDAYRVRATDVHLDQEEASYRVRFRIDGNLIDAMPLNAEQGKRLVNQTKTLARIDPVRLHMPVENRISMHDRREPFDVRVVAAPTVTGEKLALRMLRNERQQRTIEQLGVSARQRDQLVDWINNTHGLLLITGATGSGKTTTLYAILDQLNRSHRAIVTLEDPVEYQIDGLTQMQVNDKQGLTFAAGIKSMLRLDPDYLVVGELRDAESARTAVSAGITGHVLLGTMHSEDPASAITRLRHWGVANHEIAASVSLIVAQRLVRKLCSVCAVAEEPESWERDWFTAHDLTCPDQLHRPKGCVVCDELGFIGRTGLFEIWSVNHDDQDAIVKRVAEHDLRRRLAARDHTTLLHRAADMIGEGVTTVREVANLVMKVESSEKQ